MQMFVQIFVKTFVKIFVKIFVNNHKYVNKYLTIRASLAPRSSVREAVFGVILVKGLKGPFEP